MTYARVQRFKKEAYEHISARTKEDLLSDIHDTLERGIKLLRPIVQKLHSKSMVKSSKPAFPEAVATKSTQPAHVMIRWEGQYTMHPDFSTEESMRGPHSTGPVDRDRDAMLKELKAAVPGFQKVDGDTPYTLAKSFQPVGRLLDRKDTEIQLMIADHDQWLATAVYTYVRTKDLVAVWDVPAPQAIRELNLIVSKLARSALKG